MKQNALCIKSIYCESKKYASKMNISNIDLFTLNQENRFKGLLKTGERNRRVTWHDRWSTVVERVSGCQWERERKCRERGGLLVESERVESDMRKREGRAVR